LTKAPSKQGDPRALLGRRQGIPHCRLGSAANSKQMANNGKNGIRPTGWWETQKIAMNINTSLGIPCKHAVLACKNQPARHIAASKSSFSPACQSQGGIGALAKSNPWNMLYLIENN
jgi:hypothetical protein